MTDISVRGWTNFVTVGQRRILDRVLTGMPDKEIATELNLSWRTVKNHVATLLTLFGARNRTELVSKILGARIDELEDEISLRDGVGP